MSYSQDIYEQAEKIISKRKITAEKENEKRKKEIYAKIPQIKSIDNEIASTSVTVLKEIMTNKPDINEILEGLKIKNFSLSEEKKHLLKNNGYPQDYLNINYYCKKCNDTGYSKQGICECMKNILKNQAYQKLNMTVDIQKYKFCDFSIDCYPDNYIVSEKTQQTPKNISEKNLRYCENYANSFNNKSQSILMQGGTGLGKTHLSLAIAGVCIDNGIGVIYASAQQLLHKLEQEKFKNSDEKFLENVLTCDLLIIDDLGTEFYTQFTVSAFYNIINSRLQEQKPTIINTNLSIEEILTKYSQRIASRIIGEYHLLRFYGKDLRLTS